ncbi:MAG TPA: hypothetical protein VJJ81_01390 [Candidatus Babeliales bacterium]|nr:hypothetical protein [Candidatus Babeliales bacterium]
MGLNFKYHASTIYRLVGLWLILLAISPSSPMTFPQYIRTWRVYDDSVKAGGKVDIAPLELMLADLRAISAPNAGTLGFLADRLALSRRSTKDAVIAGLEQRKLAANELAEDLLKVELFEKFGAAAEVESSGSDGASDGGVAESKGGGADGPSPDASIGGASGPRFSALASKPKDRDTGLSFNLSLIPGARSLQLGFAGITPRAPIIGFYDSGGYRVRMPLMVVEGTVDLLKHASPELYAQVSDISADKVEFYINIWGQFFGGNLPANNPNNVVFHEILSKWTGLSRPHSGVNCGRFNGGLFKPNGITTAEVSAAIPVSSLSAIEVNYHDEHWSPNNARFKLIDGRNIASFWLVGKQDQDKDGNDLPKPNKHAVVTLNLIINSDSSGLGAKLIRDLESSNDLATLIRSFDRSAERPARIERRTRPILPKPEAEDAQAVWNFTDVLEDMLAA